MTAGEYERGIQDQRLKDHDTHLGKINGSLGDVARELGALRTELGGVKMNLQRLTDAVESNQKLVVTTAIAVEAERKSTAEAIEIQRTTIRDTAERRWSPLTRMVAIATLASALSALIAWLISLH